MLARLELGDSIPEELYRVIAFAWRLKGKFPQGFEEAPVGCTPPEADSRISTSVVLGYN